MTKENATLTRSSVTALDEILGTRIPVLDDGFIRVVDYMGSDASVVQAARISYGTGTKRVHEDRGLIRYLMRHRHTTPFEMCEIKFHVRVPMDSWRQWIRHRTASVNEYSTRYSVAIDAARKTAPTEWRSQASENQQGSAGAIPTDIGEELSRTESEMQTLSREVYVARLGHGVAREQARKDLPLSTYTEAYWKINLHNLLHFLSLRMDRSAQYEIRAYADVIGNRIVATWCPITWAAFLDYRLNAETLSLVESTIVEAVVCGEPQRAVDVAKAGGLISGGTRGDKMTREGVECEQKLRRLGITPPWGGSVAGGASE